MRMERDFPIETGSPGLCDWTAAAKNKPREEMRTPHPAASGVRIVRFAIARKERFRSGAGAPEQIENLADAIARSLPAGLPAAFLCASSAANGDNCFLFDAGGSAAAASGVSAMRFYTSVVTIESPACNLTVCCICCFLHSVWRLQRRRPRPVTKGSAPDRAHGCHPPATLAANTAAGHAT
jgi:hypothetical protein